MKTTAMQRWVATCASGLETVLADELSILGARVIEAQAGAVTVEAGNDFGFRACLWSRIAERILLPIKVFDARMPDDVYNACMKVRWADHLAVYNSFSVTSIITQDVGHNANFITLKVKDAVVDSLRNARGERPSIDIHKPDLSLYLFWKGEDVTLYIDFAGAPLHRRGYRSEAGEAPLKETLAAGMLRLAGWSGAESVLLDPFCGSATLLIEGMQLALGIAPGLTRDYFGFLGWRQCDHTLWKKVLADAIDRREKALANPTVRGIGYDADRDTLAIARDNVKRARLESVVHLERRELAQVDARHMPPGVSGFVVTNPPFGERLGDRETIPLLYQALGRQLARYCEGWNAAILAAYIEDADRILLADPVVHRLHNGPLRVYLRCGKVRALPPRVVRLPKIHEVPYDVPDVANRIAKNLKKIRKWIDDNNVECVRLYDADIPEYNFALDWYNGDVHLQEYLPPKTVDPDKARQRLEAATRTVSQVLGISPNFIHVKSRQRQKGKDQYRKMDNRLKFNEVCEGAARLQVNFTDYLDTGLFLDHRPMRLQLETLAKGKRFLNLFCYTGAATVHAGVGGCRSSVSVDSSRTYLSWAARNLAINGLAEGSHRLLQADCRRWLLDTREQFDVIFMDPPTFSNAKARDDFDVQRDHVALIDAAMRRLERDGVLIFSNNFKKFQIDAEALSRYDLKDVTAASLPPDFAAKVPIHRCWEIRYRRD